MNSILLKASIMIASVCLALAVSPSEGQVPDKAPEVVSGVGKIEFENDSITVVRIRMAPHERTPMHDIASSRLVIWLTNAHLKNIEAGGAVREYHRAAGAIDWVTPHRHIGENLSERDLEFLAIIPKAVSAS